MDVLRNYLQGGRNLNLKHSMLKPYVFKPTNTQLLKFDEANLFDRENGHLEYFPIINQRVFSIGGQEQSTQDNDNAAQHSHKEILNVEFKQTYTRFIHLGLHQSNGTEETQTVSLDLNQKYKVQLAYYLQL